MSHLYGVHDWSPAWAQWIRDAGVTATCVTTHAVEGDLGGSSGYDFRGMADYGVTPLARINFSHHGNGSIPPNAADWPAFAERCARFVENSPGCDRFTIANEINVKVEWGRDEPVTPEQYAACYTLVARAIKARTPTAQLSPAAIGPWNVQSGVEWVAYFRRMLDAIPHSMIDFLCLHTYSRGYSPQSVTDNAWMDAPHHNRHNGFRSYKDFLEVVPAGLRDLPVDIKETNGNESWPDANTGWVQAAYAEIYRHNGIVGSQKIRSLCLFRWAHFDTRWDFSTKNGVHADFKAAVAHKYPAPSATVATIAAPTQPATPTLHVPTVAAGAPDAVPERNISDNFRRRVPDLTLGDGERGKLHYRLIRAEYVPDGARRFGPDHHILIDVLDAQGQRALGVPISVWWGNGAAGLTTHKPDGPYAADYQMHNAGHSFGVRVADSEATSDSAFGMGLGKIGSEHMGDHVTYHLVFQRTRAAMPAPAVPRPQPEAPQTPPEAPQQRPMPVTVPALTHPVQNPDYRRISQGWGLRPEYYSRFVYGGVPLKGHNGIDYKTPVSSRIVAVDDGFVVEARFDEGWGNYVKIIHPWGESLYAHLKTFLVVVGATVAAGQPIALSGNSGNSSGPHLHFGLRTTPYERADGWGGFVNPLPYLSSAGAPESPVDPAPPADIVATVRAAAAEFGVDEYLLLSLIWKESSYDPKAVNHASGAKGLGQFMPNTWIEQAAIVGATNIFDARDNARAAAHYLHSLIQTTGSERRGLWAYVWGPGRVLDLGKPGKPTQPPAEVMEYANTILHGRDLLRAVKP